MDKLTAILAKYWDDGFMHSSLMYLTGEELEEVAEGLDAFLNDFRLVGWKVEEITFSTSWPNDNR